MYFMETENFGEGINVDRLSQVIQGYKYVAEKHHGVLKDAILAPQLSLDIELSPAGYTSMEAPDLAGDPSDAVDRLDVLANEYISPDFKITTSYAVYLVSEDILPGYVKATRSYRSKAVEKWYLDSIYKEEVQQLIEEGNVDVSLEFEDNDDVDIISPDFLEACGAPNELVRRQMKLAEYATSDAAQPAFGTRDIEKLESYLKLLKNS